MDWSLVLGIIAGIGTTIGTIAAMEQYLSRKFIRAVKNVLVEMEIERQLRHVQNDYATLSRSFSESMGEIEERIQRCKDADIRQHAAINLLKIHQGRLEAAIRIIASSDDAKSIAAIFESSTGGTEGGL